MAPKLPKKLVKPKRVVPRPVRARILQQTPKKKIVFLCIHGLWSRDSLRRFRVFLQRKGFANNFELASVGLLDAASNPNPRLSKCLSGASLVVSPFFSEEHLLSAYSGRVKRFSPKARLVGFLIKTTGPKGRTVVDFEATFNAVLKRALSR